METAALIVSHSVENFQSPDSHQPLPHVKSAVNRGKMKREEQLGRKTPCGYRKDENSKRRSSSTRSPLGLSSSSWTCVRQAAGRGDPYTDLRYLGEATGSIINRRAS